MQKHTCACTHTHIHRQSHPPWMPGLGPRSSAPSWLGGATTRPRGHPERPGRLPGQLPLALVPGKLHPLPVQSLDHGVGSRQRSKLVQKRSLWLEDGVTVMRRNRGAGQLFGSAAFVRRVWCPLLLIQRASKKCKDVLGVGTGDCSSPAETQENIQMY